MSLPVPFGHTIVILSQPALAFTSLCCVFIREAANTDFIVFAENRPGLEHTTYMF